MAIAKKLVHPGSLPYLWSIGLIVLTGALFGFLYNKLPPEIPLYYGKPPGVKQIADKNYLLLPLVLSLILTGINYFFANLLKDNYLRSIFAVLSVLLGMISTITVIKIILLVVNL